MCKYTKRICLFTLTREWFSQFYKVCRKHLGELYACILSVKTSKEEKVRLVEGGVDDKINSTSCYYHRNLVRK